MNTPNTLDGCADGIAEAPGGGAAPSVESLRVVSGDPDAIRAQDVARVEATVRAVEGTAVDFFFTDWAARNSSWRYLGRVRTPGPGVHTVGVPFAAWYAVPAAVRAVVVDAAAAGAWEQVCSSGDPRGDTDDLVFMVEWANGPLDESPPAARVVAPAPDSVAITLPVHVEVEASDDVLVQRVEYWVRDARVGMSFVPPYTFDWTPEVPPSAGERVMVWAHVYDGLGRVAFIDPVFVTFGDATPPTVSFLPTPAIVGPVPVTLEVQAEDGVNGSRRSSSWWTAASSARRPRRRGPWCGTPPPRPKGRTP